MIYDDIFMNAWPMSHVSKTEEVNFYIDKFKKNICRFLWICGASIPFSIHSRQTSGISKLNTFKEIILRSLKLVLLGIVVNTSTRNTAVQLENVRLPGVLQRFGISYLIGATLLLMFYKETNSAPNVTTSGQEVSRFIFFSLIQF